MRNAFAKEITRLAQADPRIVLLSGDIGNKLFDDFKASCPGRFYNCGVAEANMIGVAAGLALSGFRPVCYTIAPFITYRCMEQIRIDVCYHKAPVIIVGTGAGLAYASLGATHHSCEEMGMLRTLPGLSVLAPADSAELCACLGSVIDGGCPAYVRIGKKGEPVVHASPPSVGVGRGQLLRDGKDAFLLCAGTLLPEALKAADLLSDEGLSIGVASMPSVKPLDLALLARITATTSLVLTLEEHGLIGGFGAAIAEQLSDHPVAGLNLLRCGTKDEFLHQTGEQEEARAHFGLDAAAVAAHLGNALRARIPS